MKKAFTSSTIQSIGDILTKFNPLEDKFISREFQSYGCYLTEELNDIKHKALYMRLAKTLPRAILEKALSFVKDANVKRKGALFMWKLKELGAWKKEGEGERVKGEQKKGGKKKTVEDIPF